MSGDRLDIAIKRYAIDLRRNANGGDDYPYDFAKGVADYLGVLVKRAKGDCTCAQAGFPDSCDNCDGLAADEKRPPLRLCGYCQTWNSKPCGEQCRWSPSDPVCADVVGGSSPCGGKAQQ